MEKKKLIIGVIVLVVLGGVMFFFIQKGEQTEYPPLEIDWYDTTTQETQEGKVIENKTEKYRLTVPVEWYLTEEGNYLEGLKVVYPKTEKNTEFNEGVMLIVKTSPQNENQTIETFLEDQDRKTEGIPFKAKIGEGLKINVEQQYDPEDEFYKQQRTDREEYDYVFTKNHKIYWLICFAEGLEYKSLNEKCETSVKTLESYE